MSFKEVGILRKAGNLEDAFKMAEEDLASNPDDIWSKRAISWVYYEYLKQNAEKKNTKEFIDVFKNIIALELDESEVMIFDNIAFQIFKLNNSLFKTNIDTRYLNELFDLVKDCSFTNKQVSYSVLFKAFHKANKEWNRYIEFVDWWGLDNFIEDDFQPYKMDNGKDVMSLVEQAYIAYARILLEKAENYLTSINEKAIIKEEIIKFIPLLENIIETHPEYKYPSYYQAKLLIATGGDNVLETFIPFAKKMKNNFWVWDLMSDFFPNDKSTKFACLCKALSLNSPNTFLNKVRIKIVKILVEKELFAEAKTEIEIINDVIKKENWKANSVIENWKKQTWFADSKTLQNNNILYAENSKIADLLLFADLPNTIITISFVNKYKKILNFIDNEKNIGFLKYANIIKHPKIGDVYNAKIKKKSNSEMYDLFFAEKETNIESKNIREIEGNIEINRNGFGFVDGVFVPKNLIEKYKLVENQKLQGLAMASFNKKKNEWGFVLININNHRKLN